MKDTDLLIRNILGALHFKHWVEFTRVEFTGESFPMRNSPGGNLIRRYLPWWIPDSKFSNDINFLIMTL